MQRSKYPSQGSYTVFHGLALVGGHPALDFLNTVKYRGAAVPNDRLATFMDVVDWTRVAGLISDVEARNLAKSIHDISGVARLHEEICAFREHLRLLFYPPEQRNSDYHAAVTEVEAATTALRPVARVDRDSVELTWIIPIEAPHDLKARIVNAAAELLAARSRLRIKTCSGDDCDWLFIDRTKATRRLWCDTRTCGNIARVRRHRFRRKAS